MIPFFEFHTISLGPFILQVWGIFVALGIFISAFVLERRAKAQGLDSERALSLMFWMLFGAFVGARLAHVFFYDFSFYAAHLEKIFAIWDGGWSSIGGIFGAILVFLIFHSSSNKLQVPSSKIIAADLYASVFPLGMAVGRVGCFFIHDHPGTLSHSFLAVRFPDGPRFDLGLLESLDLFLLTLIVGLLYRRLLAQPGWLAIFVLSWYALTRFFLDFLRARDGVIIDQRFFGLTPAQYGLIILGLGLCLAFYYVRNQPQRFAQKAS